VAKTEDMSLSPLRFTSTVKVHDVARAVVARDTARARKFLAGTQPHGPKAHKSPELRRRGAVTGNSHDHHTSHSSGHSSLSSGDDSGHDDSHGNLSQGNDNGHTDSHGHVNLSEDTHAVDDTIDATDAGLLGPLHHIRHASDNCHVPALIYTTSVGVGSPPADYVLVIDTGSSNTWVGAGKEYRKTGTTQETGNDVVSHGSVQHRPTVVLNFIS
jgi:Eukaryotic aspartyl protease